MGKYDDASWHYDGVYPEDLQHKNAATHIGIFLTWCIDNDLISEFQKEEVGDDIESVKNRTITGAGFLINNCDEKFTEEDLNDLGNEFAADYYEDNTEFGEKYRSYLSDYSKFFLGKIKANKKDYSILYHIEDSWDNYYLIKPIIAKRFAEWKYFNLTR